MATPAAPTAPADLDRRAAVLTAAARKAADYLDLSNSKVGAILGLSAATVSRLRAGRWTLPPQDKSFELAQYFIRLFRGLDSVMGSNDAASRWWLTSFNHDLGARPIDKLDRIAGLLEVCDYVDAGRARV